MKPKWCAAVVAAGIFAALGSGAWSAAAQAKPAGEEAGLKAIWAYAGVWKTEMEHVDTAYSKAGKEAHTLKNDCWMSGVYVACRQIVDDDAKVLIVFTCKDERNCTSHQIPPHEGDAGSGKLTLEGNTWTFPWSVTNEGKTTYFRVVNVWSSATTIEFRQEFSTDEQHWTVMATGHEVKIAAK